MEQVTSVQRSEGGMGVSHGDSLGKSGGNSSERPLGGSVSGLSWKSV